MEKYVCWTRKLVLSMISLSHVHMPVEVVHRSPLGTAAVHRFLAARPSFEERWPRKDGSFAFDGGTGAVVTLADGTRQETDEKERNVIDPSRCEQLMGKKPQLYGCGVCVSCGFWKQLL
jgi:hypothetical protein